MTELVKLSISSSGGGASGSCGSANNSDDELLADSGVSLTATDSGAIIDHEKSQSTKSAATSSRSPKKCSVCKRAGCKGVGVSYS